MARFGRQADERVIAGLAAGGTVRAVAATTGVSERTIFRRLENPAFVARVAEAKRATAQRTTDLLTAVGEKSVKTLVDLQKEGVAPSVRLGAAKAALELGPKHRELTEMEERLAALEANQPQPKGRPR